jgi:signal transduction histidine kinase
MTTPDSVNTRPDADLAPSGASVAVFGADSDLVAQLEAQREAASIGTMLYCDDVSDLVRTLHDEVLDLVIVDHRRSALDVVELVRLVAAAASDLPVVVIDRADQTADPALQLELLGLGSVWLVSSEDGADGRLGRALRRLVERSLRLRAVDRQVSQLSSWIQTTRHNLDELLHDLRTPVSIVQGFCSNLLEGLVGPLSRDQRASLERMEAANDLLVEELRAFRSRLPELFDDGETSPYRWLDARRTGRRRLRLEEVCAEVVGLFELTADEKGIALALVAAEDLPSVWGSRSRLSQLLVNLLSNACRVTPSGGRVTVELSPAQIESPHGARPASRLTVRDTGPGIPAERLESIFERGWRGDGTGGRAGLGLSICREVAEEHRAELTVESRAGEGSAFHLVLPVDPRSRPVRVHLVDDADLADRLLISLCAAQGTPRRLPPASDADALARHVLKGGTAVLLAVETGALEALKRAEQE